MVGADDFEDAAALPAPIGAAVTGAPVIGAVVVVVLDALTVLEGVEVFTLVVTSVGALALGAAVGAAVGDIALEGSLVVGVDLVGPVGEDVGESLARAIVMFVVLVAVVGEEVGESIAMAMTVLFDPPLVGAAVTCWIGATVGAEATVFEIL